MSAATVRKQIKESEQAIKEVMQIGLSIIGETIVDKVMRNARNSTPSTLLSSIKGVTPSGVNQYKKDLINSMAIVSSEAIKQARKEVPKAARVKMQESNDLDGSIQFANIKSGTLDTVLFDNLPVGTRKRIKSAADLLVDTQIADLEKSIFFQFNSSAVATDSMSQLEYEISQSALDYVEGPSVAAGASVTAANVVNESRNAFFLTEDVLEEIEAFEFVNGDPVTQICTSLDGTVFAKNDPDMFKYTGPLHYGCKSTMMPILNGNLKGREITKLQSKYDDQIQFSEIETACRECSRHFN